MSGLCVNQDFARKPFLLFGVGTGISGNRVNHFTIRGSLMGLGCA
jgi:hypothetical protein